MRVAKGRDDGVQGPCSSVPSPSPGPQSQSRSPVAVPIPAPSRGPQYQSRSPVPVPVPNPGAQSQSRTPVQVPSPGPQSPVPVPSPGPQSPVPVPHPQSRLWSLRLQASGKLARAITPATRTVQYSPLGPNGYLVFLFDSNNCFYCLITLLQRIEYWQSNYCGFFNEIISHAVCAC